MDAIEERVELGSIDALVRFADGAWSIVLVAAGTSEPIETVSIDGLDADGLDSVIDDLLDVVDEVDREAAAPLAPPPVMQAETRVTNAGRDRAVELLREVQRMVDDGTRVLSRDATERFNLLRADVEAPSTADEDAIGRASALREEIAALPRREMDLDAVADRVGAELFAAGLVAPEEKPDDLDDGTREAFELNSRAQSELDEIERVGDPSALATHKEALVEASRLVADLAEKITRRISGESKTAGAWLLSLAKLAMASVDVVVDRVVRDGPRFEVSPNLPPRVTASLTVGLVHVASIAKTPVQVSAALYNRLVVPQGDREDHYGTVQANAARLIAGAQSAISSAINRRASPSEPIVYGQQEHDPRRSYFVEPTPGALMVPRFITDKIVLTMVRPEGERYPTGVRLALEGESAASAITAPPPAPPAIDPKAKLRPGPDDTAPSAPATGDGPAARIFYQYGLHVDASGPGASDEDVNAAAVAGELALAKALGVKHKPSGRNAVGVDADGHVRTTGVILTEAGWMLPDDVTKIKPAQRALMANQGEAQRIVVGAVAATLRGRGYTVTAEVDGDDNSVTVSTKAAKTKDMKTKAATKNAPADRGIWTVLVKRADDPTAVDYESKAAGELQQVTESLSAGGSMEAELSHWKGAEIMASDDAKAKVARLRLVASALRFAADPIRGGTTEDMERWEGMGEPELGVSQSDVDDALRGIAPILTALKETGAKDRTESTNEEMPDVLYLGQHPDSADVPYVLTTGYSEALPLGTVLRRDDGYVFVKNAQRDQWQLSDPSKFGVPVIARGASGKFRVTEYEPAAALLASASIADVRPVVTSKGFGKERIVTGWRAWVKVPESDEVMADYVRLASGAAKSEFVSILTKRMELFTGVPVEFRDGPEDSFVSTSNLVIEFVPKAVAPAGALDESDVLAMFDDV